VQEAAVEALTMHATQGRVRLLASPASACAGVLAQRLKDERHSRYLLANLEIDLNQELDRTSINQEPGWQEKMNTLLERRGLVRNERTAVAEAIRSLHASLNRTHVATTSNRAEAFALRLWLARSTQQRARWQAHGSMAQAHEGRGGAEDRGEREEVAKEEESEWQVPMVVPEEAAESGTVSWTLRSFPHLETLAPSAHMIEGGAAALADLWRLWLLTHGGGRPYVPLLASVSVHVGRHTCACVCV